MMANMSTSVVQPKRRAPPGSPIGRSDRGVVSGKLKAALDLVVNEGLDPYEAAAKLNYHARSMRMALAKRHVLAYLRAQREVLRQTASAQNIHHAIDMRAHSSNEMCRLGAMKFIEQIEDEARSGGRPGAPLPGLQIVIYQDRPAPRVIDVTPTADAASSSEPARTTDVMIPAPWPHEPAEPSPPEDRSAADFVFRHPLAPYR
jgi:hypothetical protein